MLITPGTKAGLAVSEATKPAIQQKLKQKVLQWIETLETYNLMIGQSTGEVFFGGSDSYVGFGIPS